MYPIKVRTVILDSCLVLKFSASVSDQKMWYVQKDIYPFLTIITSPIKEIAFI